MAVRIATFDLDSTLCDTEHRHNLIDRTKDMDWLEYSKACGQDALVEGVAELVHLCREVGVEVHYVTGRMDGARSETIEWLVEYLGESEDGGLGPALTDRLHMDETKSGDHVTEFGSHAAYKVHRIEQLIFDLDATHLFHVDDYPTVALGLSEKGIKCVAVRAPFEVRQSVSGALV